MFDLACQAGQAVSGWFDGMVAQVADGASEFVVTMSSWWVRSGSVNVTDPAVTAAQEVTGPLVGVILVGSVLVQAIRIMISRKGEGLVFIVTGLLRYAATAGLGLVLLQTALAAGDALATEILDDAVTRYAQFMRDALVVGGGVGAFPILVVSIIAGILALIQYLLMALRQAGLLVLAAMLPLAASGSLTRSTRGWLERLIPWLIALVCYKPAAALIYYVGFAYVSSGAGSGGSGSSSGNSAGGGSGDLATMLTGLMVLLLAVLAMPVMLRFFSWSGIQIGGASGGSGVLGAAGAIANTRMYMGGRAVQRAAALEATGPGSRATPGSTPSGGGAGAAGAAVGAGRAGPAGRSPVGGGTRLAGASVAGAAGAAVAAGGAAVRAAGRTMAEPPPADNGGDGAGGSR